MFVNGGVFLFLTSAVVYHRQAAKDRTAALSLLFLSGRADGVGSGKVRWWGVEKKKRQRLHGSKRSKKTLSLLLLSKWNSATSWAAGPQYVYLLLCTFPPHTLLCPMLRFYCWTWHHVVCNTSVANSAQLLDVYLFHLLPTPSLLACVRSRRDSPGAVSVLLNHSQSTGLLSTPYQLQVQNHSAAWAARGSVKSIPTRPRCQAIILFSEHYLNLNYNITGM